MLCGLWWLEDTLCIINLMMNAFSNTPKWATSLQILDDLSPEKGQHGGDAGPAGSSTDQLPTPPRFSPATLLVPTLGALVIWPVLFHWGFKHPCVERKGHMFFRVEEIIDFRSCSYSFVQFLNRDYLYKHCLTGISSPRSRYSSGLPLGAVLPLGGGIFGNLWMHFLCHSWGRVLLLASNRWRSWMLLNIPRGTDSSVLQRQCKTWIVLRLRRPALQKGAG